MKILSHIFQTPELPWQNWQNPITPGLSTNDYSNFYYAVIIVGIIALILIVIYGLIGEEKEEEVGYE